MNRLRQCGCWVVMLAGWGVTAWAQPSNAVLGAGPQFAQRGWSELRERHWTAAEQDFRAALSLQPTNAEAYDGLGRSLFNLRQYSAALAAFERSVALNSKNPSAVFSLALANYRMGRLPRAAEGFENYTMLNPRDAQGYYWLARAWSGQGRFTNAENAVRLAVGINPTNALYKLEFGYCLAQLRRYDQAIRMLHRVLSLDPTNADAYFWLGICHYRQGHYHQSAKALQECLALAPASFAGHYWLGLAWFELYHFDAAARSFHTAARLHTNSFEANYWCGISRLAGGQFARATPSLERAHALRHRNSAVRRELFLCYLLTTQYGKAYRLWPMGFSVSGGVLTLAYIVLMTLLLKLSFPVRRQPAPGLWFSLAWVGLFFEGQLAFILPLALLFWLQVRESLLAGIILAGIPVIVAAAKGFSRQPWGAPFAWPPRLGNRKIVLRALVGLALAMLFDQGYSVVLGRLTSKAAAVQETVPLIQFVLKANPATAVVAVVLVAPLVEEILFRGLIYGALEARWGAAGAIPLSALLFALAHLQVVGFLPIFCLGLVLAWARWQTGSIGLGVLLHALNNGLALGLLRWLGAGT